jgi:hypothetical protein
VVGAQAGLAGGQGALVEGAGAVEVALGAQDAGEVLRLWVVLAVIGAHLFARPPFARHAAQVQESRH